MERLEQLIAITTGRAEILNRINQRERSTEELDWSDLRDQAYSGTPAERNEGQRVLHRKLALSLSPFLFAILGGAIGLRVKQTWRTRHWSTAFHRPNGCLLPRVATRRIARAYWHAFAGDRHMGCDGFDVGADIDPLDVK